MQKYAYGERVVKKVRSLLGHDQRFKDIIKPMPSVDLGSDFCLESLVWNYYELQIVVTRRNIVFSNRNQRSVIMSYNGFDALLGMK